MGQESGLDVAKLDSLLKASQGQNYCLVLDGSCLKALGKIPFLNSFQLLTNFISWGL